jgi:hypothetical protein
MRVCISMMGYNCEDVALFPRANMPPIPAGKEADGVGKLFRANSKTPGKFRGSFTLSWNLGSGGNLCLRVFWRVWRGEMVNIEIRTTS